MRRLSRIFLFYVLPVFGVLAACLLALVLLAVQTPTGTQYVLSTLTQWLPQLKIVQPTGALTGQFKAQRIEWLGSQKQRVVLTSPGWSGLRLHWARHARWYVGIHWSTLHLNILQVDWPSSPKKNTPATLPKLNLPIAVAVKNLSIGQIISPQIGPDAISNIKGSVKLQSPYQSAIKGGGVQHLIYLHNMHWQVWKISGSVQTTLGENTVLAAKLNGSSAEGNASLQLFGPLQQFNAKGTVNIGQAKSQQLHFSARLTPLSAWPVQSAQVNASQLNLKQLNRLWPSSRLTGHLKIPPPKQASNSLPLAISMLIQLRNDLAGPWNAGQIPIRHMQGQLQSHIQWPIKADTKINQKTLGSSIWRVGDVDAQLKLFTPSKASSTVDLKGYWHLGDWKKTVLHTRLNQVDLKSLHTQAPALLLSGPISVQGITDQTWRITGDINGTNHGHENRIQPVLIQWEARWHPERLVVDALKLRSSGAQADIKGLLYQPKNDSWQAKSDIHLINVDPAVWLPWPRASGDTVQPTRLKGQVQIEAAWQGKKLLDVNGLQISTKGQWQDSFLLGVQTAGQWLVAVGQNRLTAEASIQASGNHAQMHARLPMPAKVNALTMAQLHNLEANVKLQAPQLSALQAWAAPLGMGQLAGQMHGEMQFNVANNGQWRTTGQVQADKFLAHWRNNPTSIDGMSATWALSNLHNKTKVLSHQSSPPLQLTLHVKQAQWADWHVQQLQTSLQGTLAQHDWQTTARVDLPPRPLPSGRMFKQSLQAQWAGQGQWLAPLNKPPQWSAKVTALRLAPLSVQTLPSWLDVQPFQVSLNMLPSATQWQISPVRLGILGVAFDVQQAQGQIGQHAENSGFNLQASMLPVRATDLLAQWQQQGKWGGDLMLQGNFNISHVVNRPWKVKADVSRVEGDLIFVDTDIEGSKPQALGIKQFFLQLEANNGVWTANESVEGTLLGKIEGQQTVKPSVDHALPTADAALQGYINASISDARALGAWAPASWRLAGQVQAKTDLSGTLGQPYFSGEMVGQQIVAQNPLLGIDLSGGMFHITLKGKQAQLDNLTFVGGGEQGGLLEITGQANLDGKAQADLQIVAKRFNLLNRVDRQARLSGQAIMQLSAQSGKELMKVDGDFTFDNGLFDISQQEAPTIGDDVNIINQKNSKISADSANADASSANKGKTPWQVNLALNLGDKLRLKGRGIDTLLQGALKLTTINGRTQLHGSINAVNGTYFSYGQNLLIDRGTLTFTGPIDNPRLDIKASRVSSSLAESSDVKVGVLISATALDPRVRLYSEPPLSETEKLSWLVLGRGPAGLGVADIGLLQTAASALWAREGGSPKDSLVSTIGLDELSIRQSDGAVRNTIITVGKQISRRWYLGYERSLTNTTGSWQAVYKAAQRFTLRLQTGQENAADLIWLWRQSNK